MLPRAANGQLPSAFLENTLQGSVWPELPEIPASFGRNEFGDEDPRRGHAIRRPLSVGKGDTGVSGLRILKQPHSVSSSRIRPGFVGNLGHDGLAQANLG